MAETFNKTNALDPIKSEEVKIAIKARTQSENPIADGIQCPHCGVLEAYKNDKEPRNTDLWYWMIRAFKVDNWSDCRNCGKWFQL